jgi:hypothetical protein
VRKNLRARVVLGVALLAPGALSCGASIQAVYEGDVRFEHCMALDSRPDVKPTIRRACWEEWMRFYTFGQNRDRVEYARLRDQQLGSASDFEEAPFVPEKKGPSAVPEPTSALAPPPMMLATDGGAPEAPASPSPQDKPPMNADCTTECEQAWNFCKQDCRTPNCEKACQAKYKRCMKRCF